MTKPCSHVTSIDIVPIGPRRIRITEEHRAWMLQIRNSYLQKVREFIESFSYGDTTPGERSFELLDSISSLEGDYKMLRELMGKEEERIPLPPDIQNRFNQRRQALIEYLRRIQSGEVAIA